MKIYHFLSVVGVMLAGVAADPVQNRRLYSFCVGGRHCNSPQTRSPEANANPSTENPSASPSGQPSAAPTVAPSSSPTASPTESPAPSSAPTGTVVPPIEGPDGPNGDISVNSNGGLGTGTITAISLGGLGLIAAAVYVRRRKQDTPPADDAPAVDVV